VAADRKPFLLRLDPKVLEALQRWARDDLRSLNGQLEYLLRGLLVRAGRLPDDPAARGASAGAPPADPSGGGTAKGPSAGGTPSPPTST